MHAVSNMSAFSCRNELRETNVLWPFFSFPGVTWGGVLGFFSRPSSLSHQTLELWNILLGPISQDNQVEIGLVHDAILRLDFII